MAKEKIFIVEDEEDILELIRYNLGQDGYEIDYVTNGDEAFDKICATIPNLIILDLMLPGTNGISICKALKAEASTKSIPIIMVTAKGEENDIVHGLEIGAQDYIKKPFSVRELRARVRAILRTQSQKSIHSDRLVHGALTIDLSAHEIFVNDNPIILTASEFKVLHLLASKPGRVFTRAQIVEGIRGNDYPVTQRSVDVLLVGLRKKIGECGKAIITVRGIGYKFKPI